MGQPAFVENYLFVGPLIAARLVDQVEGLPADHIEAASQLVGDDQRRQVAKVMWAGDRVDTSDSGRARDGASQIVHQRWLVALLLRNEGQQLDARHATAGPLLSRIHRALAGWVPEGGMRPLRRAQAPLSPTLTEVHAVYPLGFEITLTL